MLFHFLIRLQVEKSCFLDFLSTICVGKKVCLFCLTSLSIPNLGRVQALDEHFPQKTWPHALQWCWRVIRPNSTRHRWQTAPSAHPGALSASYMASASRTGGKVHPSAFIRLRVSWITTKITCNHVYNRLVHFFYSFELSTGAFDTKYLGPAQVDPPKKEGVPLLVNIYIYIYNLFLFVLC